MYECIYCGRRGDCTNVYEGICGDTPHTLPDHLPKADEPKEDAKKEE
jgi:hypothetical protein